MAVAFKVGPMYYTIGAGNFLYSFFSTIAQNLEQRNWGSRFPYLMNKLFNDGKLPNKEIPNLEVELKTIRESLKKFPPNKVVWDFEDLTKRPPWGDQIAKTITDLSNYFITSNGKDLFDIFFKVLKDAKEVNLDIELDDKDFL